MKNVTVTLPEETALWLRVRAAEANRSVSSWLAEVVEGMKRREDDYRVAMSRALARKPRKMAWVDGRKPTREELHDRAGLRRHQRPGLPGRCVGSRQTVPRRRLVPVPLAIASRHVSYDRNPIWHTAKMTTMVPE
ncbi:MAG: hypothetical protein OXH04_16025 [Acidobacteria bacterium]|nr:hypothetical protein [Acidobacteriota bacterium]